MPDCLGPQVLLTPGQSRCSERAVLELAVCCSQGSICSFPEPRLHPGDSASSGLRRGPGAGHLGSSPPRFKHSQAENPALKTLSVMEDVGDVVSSTTKCWYHFSLNRKDLK